MNIEEALEIVESILDRGHLNRVQEIVFRQSWEGQSYTEIANNSDYEVGYIRDTGSKLWQVLSQALGKKVTKNNLHGVLKQQAYVATRADSLTGYVFAAKWQQAHLSSSQELTTAEKKAQRSQDWGDAIDVSIFYNRTAELATLEQWLVQERCRLVTLCGMGGIGKTALTAKLAQIVQAEFQYLIWRSLRNAPPLPNLLAELIQFLSQNQPTDLPTTLDEQISRLLECLRSSRCLLILDNLESILLSGDYAGCYQAGYEGYGQLLRCVAETPHSSCLVLTSREKPKSLAAKEGEKLPVRSLRLSGLDPATTREIVQTKGEFWASAAEWRDLSEHYGGNPLALKMVVPVIQDFFEGSVPQFLLCLNQGPLVIDELRHLLNQQFNRLSGLEIQLMYYLVAKQEFVSFRQLLAEFGDQLGRNQILVALASLHRRSLVEKVADRFILLPLIREYVTELFIQKA